MEHPHKEPVYINLLTENLGGGGMTDALAPELVSPLVSYLVSPSCELTHEIFSVGGGRISRVFLGATPGWSAGAGTRFQPEDVAANLDAIMSTEGYIIPGSVGEESRAGRERFS